MINCPDCSGLGWVENKIQIKDEFGHEVCKRCDQTGLVVDLTK